MGKVLKRKEALFYQIERKCCITDNCLRRSSSLHCHVTMFKTGNRVTFFVMSWFSYIYWVEHNLRLFFRHHFIYPPILQQTAYNQIHQQLSVKTMKIKQWRPHYRGKIKDLKYNVCNLYRCRSVGQQWLLICWKVSVRLNL